MKNIKTKFIGLGKLLFAKSWFLITENTVNASYPKDDNNSLIRSFAKVVEKVRAKGE